MYFVLQLDYVRLWVYKNNQNHNNNVMMRIVELLHKIIPDYITPNNETHDYHITQIYNQTQKYINI